VKTSQQKETCCRSKYKSDRWFSACVCPTKEEEDDRKGRVRNAEKVLLAVQVQVLKQTGDSFSNPEQIWSDKFHLDVNNITMENSSRLWMPLRHSKAWDWILRPSTVKLVGVLQLALFERLWHLWGRNSRSRKCQWAAHINVRVLWVWVLLIWISSTNEVWLSKKLNSAYGVSINSNFGKYNNFCT
jgi:hypothetical protein